MNGHWQPIETAPKDGTRILVMSDSRMIVAWWRPGFTTWLSQPGAYSVGHVTHWMLLPDPPSETQG